MKYTAADEGQRAKITELFRKTFKDSEGGDEGRLIGELAFNLLATTSTADLFTFIANTDEGGIAGGILFTRLDFPDDTRTVFLLAPVAVATDNQGQGVGQKLIRFGLSELRDRGVDTALTYGDINFYKKVGFEFIAQQDARPPLPLSHPEGWLGQMLDGEPFQPLKGPSSCVEAFRRPEYW